jgi:hypothetical protein
MLAKVFDAFVEASPVSVMARGLAERLFDAHKLDAWFESVDTSQYTRELPFSAVFSLMSQVVCGSQKSVNAAYQSAKEEVPTSIVSVYNKLKGIEVETSAGLVRYAAGEATALIEALEGAVPERLPGYRVKLLDGGRTVQAPCRESRWWCSTPRCTCPSMCSPARTGIPRSARCSVRCSRRSSLTMCGLPIATSAP